MVNKKTPDDFSDDELEEEVWALFAEDGREALDLVEETLLALEADPTNAEQVAKLFRGLHTFKGNARIMGLSVVESLAHHAEDLVTLVRDEGVALTSGMINLLLEVLDHSRVMLDRTLACRLDADTTQVKGLMTRLEGMLAEHSERVPSREAAPQGPDESVEESVGEAPLPSAVEEEEGEAEDFIPVEEAIDPATDPLYVQIFLEMVEEELSRLYPALDVLVGSEEREREGESIQEVRTVVDILTHAAGRMGYERLGAMLEDLMAAVEDTEGEARNAKLNELESAIYEEVVAIQDRARSLGLEVSAQLPMRGPRGYAEDETVVSDQPDRQTVRRPEGIEGDRRVVSAETLADLAGSVGELLATRATLHRVTQRLTEKDLLETVARLIKQSDGDWQRVRQGLQNSLEPWIEDLRVLSRVETEMGMALDRLQEMALALRAKPAAEILDPLQPLVQEMAQRQGKIVKMDVRGADIRVEDSTLNVLADPVRHLVQFAVTHSIERPAQRQETGKRPTGRISVAVREATGRLQVMIEDDGRGVGNEASDVEGIDLAAITAKLQAHQGRLNVTSAPGEGTRFQLELPLDVAVIDGMVARIGSVRYVVPIKAVRRIVQSEEAQVVHSSADGAQSMLRLKEELLPILTLTGEEKDASLEKLLLVLETGERDVALAVDELIGQQQVLIQPLSGRLAEMQGVSGCALLGEGEVSLVLDLGQMDA